LGRRFVTIGRKKYFIGVEEDAEKIAEADFEGFAIAPHTCTQIIGKHPGVLLGALVSAAHGLNDWTGTPFFSTSAVKPVIPGKRIGSKWLNAIQNAGATVDPDALVAGIQNLQDRRGFDNKVLGLNGTHLWLPTKKL